jgi:ComF family protein
LPVTNRCVRCANPLPESGACGVCPTCDAYPPSYDATIFAIDYAPPLDHLILQLKFSARLPLAPWFAELLRDAVLARPGLPLPELLCPVPLGPSRLVERGYNQALEIARPLARALGVALAPTLAARRLDTRAQSGVSPHERADNIRGAFAVADPDLVAGRHIGIVDDVMTSGSTLEELAATFKRYGAARVSNLVVARTPPRGAQGPGAGLSGKDGSARRYS